MLSRVPKLKVGAAAILLLLVFFLAPIVPFWQSVSVPGAYESGLTECLASISQDNATLARIQQIACQERYMSPPVTLYGFATPAYTLFSYGGPPFPSQELVTVGNHSALVFFSGSRAVAVESVGGPGVQVNPRGVMFIQNAAVSSFDFGFLNITIKIRSLGAYDIDNPVLYLSMEGFSTNQSSGGLTVIQPKFLGACGPVLASADYCSVSMVAPNNIPLNESFHFYVEARGSVSGSTFVYRQGFGEDYPRGGIGPLWVKAFIDQADTFRGGSTLTENSTLDTFAALRFKDASANFGISDYNFTVDANAFFGPSQYVKELAELLFYPGIYSPSSYPTFLSMYAPGHWSVLTNPIYKQYGYYVGHSSYYEVSVPCPVYEIPEEGVNITQFFGQHGCATTVLSTTWLVLVLSP